MLDVPHDLYTTEQTRELERIACKEYNISSSELMKRAGTSALAALKYHWPRAESILVVCGTGNNGGDGFELARQATAGMYGVTVIQVGDKSKLTNIATAARESLLATGCKIQPFKDKLPTADVIVDAIVGVGLNREPIGEYSAAIRAINLAKGTPVLSLDIPSGLGANTGMPFGNAVTATICLNYLALNLGLFTGDGPNYAGEVHFDSLKIPSAVYKDLIPIARRITLEKDGALLAPRKRTSHKGHYGHLLVIGGNHGMSGAVSIAAEGGARVGSGLTSIATRTTHSSLMSLMRPELMSHGIEHPQDLKPLLSSANAFVLGPGLGQDTWAEGLYQKALDSNLPIVIDADALNLLSKNPQYHSHWILTPHPGEAARLLNCSIAEVQSNRLNAVKKIQKKYGGVAVLKGSGTLINNGGDLTRLSSWGNPGMASGGMGDILAGVIGGLLAQGFPLMDAACIGVALHGMAGDRAAKQDGERGMLAMDLLPHLRHLANLIF
jgi:hydroxyethylthiazole kinase-like uncharacterized protein yjeF